MPNRSQRRLDAAVSRARWLGEVAHALDQANRLTMLLRECDAASGGAALLGARITALRREIDLLQRGRRTAEQAVAPKWTE